MKRLTTWHLLSNRWNSAITEYALRAVQALSASGHRAVLSSLVDSPAFQRAGSLGLEIIGFDSFGPRAFSKFLQSRTLLAPDLIFAYGGPETFLARLAVGCRVVRFFGRDSDSSAYSRLYFPVNFSHVSSFISPNKIIARHIASLTSKPVAAIPLGLPRSELDFHCSSSTAERTEILSVGRFDPIKGHRDLFAIFGAALKKWNPRLPRPLLRVLGYEANLGAVDLRATAEQFGLSNEDLEIVTRPISDLRREQRQAHLGVISSIGSEQICRVAHEFLLEGTPVLVSGAGATEETLYRGSGASYRGLSSSQSAELLCDLVASNFADSGGKAKRQSEAEKYFSLEAMGELLSSKVLSGA